MKGNAKMAARKNATTTDAATVPEALGDTELTTTRAFNDDQLREVTSFEDAMKLATEYYGGITTSEDLELGNGFKLLGDDKDRLVGMPFIVLMYTFNEGDFGEFTSVLLVTDRGDKAILNDGSTGIYEQFKEIFERTGKSGAIFFPRGLRKSTYDTCAECGKPRKPSTAVCTCGDTSDKRAKGKTYYLDVS